MQWPRNGAEERKENIAVSVLFIMGQPLEQRYEKVPVQERVAQLRRDAARLRWEADLLRNVSGAPTFLHQVSLLRRKAYAADAKADRVMREQMGGGR